jgi:hypothetical protein
MNMKTVNNNLYQLYLKWCIDYTYNFKKVSMEFPSDHKRIIEKTKLADSELKEWKGSNICIFQSLKTWGYTCNKMAFRQI